MEGVAPARGHGAWFADLEAAALAALAERDPARGLALTAAAAELAWHDHPGRFTSPRLEVALAEVGRREAPSRPQVAPRGVLHLLTEAHGVGGHTRLAWRWIGLDRSRTHSVVLTGQPGHVPVPQPLLEAAIASGGALHLLGPDRGSVVDRARQLRALAGGFDAIVVHAHPFDVLPALALAAPGPDRPPVVWVNHVDQGFWLGTGVADLVLNVRASVGELAARRRGIDRDRLHLLPNPLEPLHRTRTRAEARAALGLEPDVQVLVTVAHPFKFAGVAGAGGTGFLEAAVPLLAERTDAVLLAVGPDATGPWAEAATATGGRIRALGYRSDLSALYEAATVVLDPFPFCSGTSVLEAALFGVPSVLLDALPPGAEVLGTDLPGPADEALVRAPDATAWRAAIGALLDDDEARAERGAALRDAVEADHLGSGWAGHVERVWDHLAALPPARPPAPDLALPPPGRLDELLLEVHRAAGRLQLPEEVVARHHLDPASVPAGATTPPTLRSIAFLLPQFHPIPENDEAWGPGFTEWHNVVRATPRFEGHHQPQLPADLGFYDLRLAETRAAQADLARAGRIDAFCWYHYWFGGRRLLEQPFEAVRRTGQPDLPFLLCWANEEWRRNWDGRTGTVLVPQAYGAEDDEAHAEHLASVFADPRYLRVDGRPVFLLYRAHHHTDPQRFADAVRRVAVAEGVGLPLLLRVASMGDEHDDPRALGFDAEVDFQPDWDRLPVPTATDDHGGRTFAYDDVVAAMDARPEPAWRRHPCVVPGWDNTARRAAGGHVLHGATPTAYAGWVERSARRAIAAAEAAGESTALVFVNAWNEWGEGAHLEPDTVHGRAFLDAHRRGVGAAHEPLTSPPPRPVAIVLAVRDEADATLACLERLIATTPDDRYEVVLVDDASTDATPALLESLEGDVRTIAKPTAIGLEAATEVGVDLALISLDGGAPCAVVVLGVGAPLWRGWLGAVLSGVAERTVDGTPVFRHGTARAPALA